MWNRNFKFVDVSHTIEHGLITYKGLPAPVICEYLTRENSRTQYSGGTTFQIGKIEMVANTGTYIDSPFHRYADGKDLSELDLDSLANLDGMVFRPRSSSRAIGRDCFRGTDLAGKAVLIHTGWDKYWMTNQYFDEPPYLTRRAAEYLESSRVALVGIDSPNIDDISNGQRPVHSTLLGSDIPIVEHLCNLKRLPDSGFTFYAVPVKVRGFGTFPVRAFGLIQR